MRYNIQRTVTVADDFPSTHALSLKILEYIHPFKQLKTIENALQRN